jgi:hypothetical protein
VTHEGKPGENQVERMVEQFEVYQEFAHKGVRRAIYVIELDDVVCHGEE